MTHIGQRLYREYEVENIVEHVGQKSLIVPCTDEIMELRSSSEAITFIWSNFPSGRSIVIWTGIRKVSLG